MFGYMCMYVHNLYANSSCQKRALIPRHWCKRVVTYHMDAGNWTLVLFKSSKYLSAESSLQLLHFTSIFIITLIICYSHFCYGLLSFILEQEYTLCQSIYLLLFIHSGLVYFIFLNRPKVHLLPSLALPEKLPLLSLVIEIWEQWAHSAFVFLGKPSFYPAW